MPGCLRMTTEGKNATIIIWFHVLFSFISTFDLFRLALQDQTGKEVDLPKAEKDALVMAMSLHQKGRAAMKKGKFELGLVLLLEATEEFDNCRAEILNVIDNYGKLNFLLKFF